MVVFKQDVCPAEMPWWGCCVRWPTQRQTVFISVGAARCSATFLLLLRSADVHGCFFPRSSRFISSPPHSDEAISPPHQRVSAVWTCRQPDIDDDSSCSCSFLLLLLVLLIIVIIVHRQILVNAFCLKLHLAVQKWQQNVLPVLVESLHVRL